MPSVDPFPPPYLRGTRDWTYHLVGRNSKANTNNNPNIVVRNLARTGERGSQPQPPLSHGHCTSSLLFPLPSTKEFTQIKWNLNQEMNFVVGSHYFLKLQWEMNLGEEAAEGAGPFGFCLGRMGTGHYISAGEALGAFELDFMNN